MELIINNINEKDYELILGAIANMLVEDLEMDAIYSCKDGMGILNMKEK